MDYSILQYNLVRPTVSLPETDKRLTPPLFKSANPIATPVSCQINPQSAFLHLTSFFYRLNLPVPVPID